MTSLPQTGCETIRGPALITPEKKGGLLEASLHTAPRALLRELAFVFPSQDFSESGCLVLPTNQNAAMDLVNIGDAVEDEKDKLLNVVRARSWPRGRGGGHGGRHRILAAAFDDRCLTQRG